MIRSKRRTRSTQLQVNLEMDARGRDDRTVAERLRWHSEGMLASWFRKLTPEQRLDIALEVEQFRREAVKVEA
jgi:hypothetical protein